MNSLIQLFFLDFKLLSKSKTFYFKLILFPILLILILGTVFGNSTAKVTNFDIAFYNQDTPLVYGNNKISFGDSLLNKVFKSTDLKSMINVKEVKSYEEGENLVKDNKVSAFVYVSKDFTKSSINDLKTSITLIGNQNKPIDKSIVKSVLYRFNQNINLMMIEEKEIIKTLSSSNAVSNDKIQTIINHIENQENYSIEVPKVATSTNTKLIDSMQYYSIAMIVMFSIMTAFVLVHSIVDDKLNNTLSRIKSTPLRNIQYVLGKLLGIIFAMVMQMIIVIIITSLVFQMEWGNIFDILLITIVYAFSIGTMVLLWGFLAKDHISVSSMASPILYGFSFLGGCFISKNSLPASLQVVQEIIPNGKAINSYLKICQGYGLGDIYINLLELLLIGIVFLIAALLVYNRKGWDNNATNNNDKKSIKATV